jgi:hypothetical protein
MELKKTITSIFMVPTLGIDKEKLKSNNFLNAYVKDARKDIQYENCVYLLFQPEDLDVFKDFLDQEYERTQQVIDDYDYEEGFVVVVYKLDKKYKRDFELVTHGKYSLTSEGFQSKFPKVVKLKKNGLNRDEISLQYRIFNRTEDLIQFWEDKLGVSFADDQEVWNGFFEDEETLNLNNIKELCLTKN